MAADPRTASLDSAVALLGAKCSHWTIKTENREGEPRRYSCKVWAGGRRFNVVRATPLDAVRAAMNRIDTQHLRIAK